MAVAREAMMLLVDSPETWPLWPKAPARLPPICRFLLPRFPYAIGVKEEVAHVLASAHCPPCWRHSQ
jgi:hypothetical protein